MSSKVEERCLDIGPDLATHLLASLAGISISGSNVSHMRQQSTLHPPVTPSNPPNSCKVAPEPARLSPVQLHGWLHGYTKSRVQGWWGQQQFLWTWMGIKPNLIQWRSNSVVEILGFLKTTFKMIFLRLVALHLEFVIECLEWFDTDVSGSF